MAEKRIQAPGSAPDPLTPREIRHALYLQTASLAALLDVLVLNGTLSVSDVAEVERRRQEKLQTLLRQPLLERPGTA